MTFEELLPKPLEEMSSAEIAELASKLDLSEALRFEKAVKKKATKRKPTKKAEAKKKQSKKLLDDLIAKGLGEK